MADDSSTTAPASSGSSDASSGSASSSAPASGDSSGSSAASSSGSSSSGSSAPASSGSSGSGSDSSSSSGASSAPAPDDFTVLLQADIADLNQQMSSLDTAKAEIQAKIDRANQMQAAYLAYGQARYVAGQNSMVLPSPADPAVQYTQAQVNQISAQTQSDTQAADKLIYQPQIDALQAQVDAGQKAVSDAQAAQKTAEDALAAEKAKDQEVISEVEADVQKLQ